MNWLKRFFFGPDYIEMECIQSDIKALKKISDENQKNIARLEARLEELKGRGK